MNGPRSKSVNLSNSPVETVKKNCGRMRCLINPNYLKCSWIEAAEGHGGGGCAQWEGALSCRVQKRSAAPQDIMLTGHFFCCSCRRHIERLKLLLGPLERGPNSHISSCMCRNHRGRKDAVVIRRERHRACRRAYLSLRDGIPSGQFALR